MIFFLYRNPKDAVITNAVLMEMELALMVVADDPQNEIAGQVLDRTKKLLAKLLDVKDLRDFNNIKLPPDSEYEPLQARVWLCGVLLDS